MHVWTLAARDGAVQRKKQDELDTPLQGPVLCKRGHAYAYARDSYWLCRMPLAGAHIPLSWAQLSTRVHVLCPVRLQILNLLLRPEACTRSSAEHAGPGRLPFRWPPAGA